jgi:hypothetical protein
MGLSAGAKTERTDALHPLNPPSSPERDGRIAEWKTLAAAACKISRVGQALPMGRLRDNAVIRPSPTVNPTSQFRQVIRQPGIN